MWSQSSDLVNSALPDALDGERADRVVAMLTGVSRSVAARAIEGDLVLVDGKPVAKTSQRLSAGQVIEIPDTVGDEDLAPAPDPSVPLNIVYVDDDVIVVDKQPGLVVHPGAGNREGTIAQGVLARFPEVADIGEKERPGIVHRLDKGTSGVFVIARSQRAYESLTDQLRERQVERRYVSFAWGQPETDRGVIEAPLGRAVRDPTRIVVRQDGKSARTSYRVLARWDEPSLALFACMLDTGRTHQIRVHLEAIHHPVVGDSRYGGGRDHLGLDRPALHASELGFEHPGTGELMQFQSPIPTDLRELLDRLGPPDVGDIAPSLLS